MRDARQGWNAAQRASERTPTKQRVLLEPVGEKQLVTVMGGIQIAQDKICKLCGYHVCKPDCSTFARQPRDVGPRPGTTDWALEELKLGRSVYRTRPFFNQARVEGLHPNGAGGLYCTLDGNKEQRRVAPLDVLCELWGNKNGKFDKWPWRSEF